MKLLIFPGNKIASFMAMSNIIFAVITTVSAIVKLVMLENYDDSSHESPIEKENKSETQLYVILAIILGILNFFIGGVLIHGVSKSNEHHVFFYLILETANLIIITIYAGINCYQSIFIAFLLICCIIYWYGLYCIYHYYTDLSESNSVKAGVIEITAQGNMNPVMFPEKEVESTAV